MRVLPGEEMKTVLHYLRIYVKSYAIVLPKTKTKQTNEKPCVPNQDRYEQKD